MKIRVLLISHTCQSRVAGQPKAHAIAAHPDIDLTLLVPLRWKIYGKWTDAEQPAEGAPFQFLARKTRLPWLKGAQNFLHHYPDMRAILSDVRPDVIDIWEEPWAAVSAQVCRLRDAMLPETRIVSETEQNLHKKYPPPFAQFRRYVAGKADHLVARNSEAVSVMRAEGYSGPATVVGNAVDESLFRPLDRDACRRETKVEGFVLGYVGRLVEEKGLEELVAALQWLPDHCRVLFVGEGPMAGRLRSLAGELGLGQRVEFRPFVAPAVLPTLMNAMDVLVLPSRTTERWKEQFGRVLIEAMACGVLVAGSSSGAIADVMGDGGIVFPERDAGALAASVLPVVGDEALRLEIAARGRARALQHYTWRAVGEQMADIYRHVTRRRA